MSANQEIERTPKPIGHLQLVEARNYKGAILDQIAEASKSIHIKTMNFQLTRMQDGKEVPDEDVTDILTAIIERKKSTPSLDIHLKFDNRTIISSSTQKQNSKSKLRRIEELRDANIRVSITKRNPFEAVMTSLPVLGPIAAKVLRDHRKVVVFDERIALIGGMNLSYDDMHRPDVMVGIVASNDTPESLRMVMALERYVFNDSILPGDVRLRFNDRGNTEILVDTGFPGRSGIRQEATNIISTANTEGSIYVSTQYFPNGSIEKQLQLAALQGTKVTIIVSEEEIVKSEPYIQSAIKRGKERNSHIENLTIVQIPEWVHAKTILRLAPPNSGGTNRVMIGSHNWDKWGVLAGTQEAVIATSDPGLITQTQDFFDTTINTANN